MIWDRLKRLLAEKEVLAKPAPRERREFVSNVVMQLWAVRADSEDAFYKFFGEDPAFWALDEEERFETPLNPFIATQGQTWFDHDFVEYALSDKAIRTEQDIPPISWSDKIGADFVARVAERGLAGVNGVLQLGADVAKDGRVDLMVPDPKDATGAGVEAYYIGTVSFEHRFAL